jgi:hypothetical protein
MVREAMRLDIMLPAASDKANACQVRRRCGAVNAAIPSTQVLNAARSIKIPLCGTILVDINKQRYNEPCY